MNLVIDPARAIGPVKPVNGVGQPPIVSPVQYPLFRYLREAGVPFSRLHDVGGMFGRNVFVDIPNVFRDFDADETDPASYDFAFTDLLVGALVESGVEPFYRLGVTIENYPHVRRYRIDPPKDYAKWARICEHVIRHYTEGWAGGFRHTITNWEIWNEPENWDDPEKNQMWHGSFEEYCRLYEVASKHLKACFPHLAIGGYGSCGVMWINAWKVERARHHVECFHAFLKFVREHGCPLDFFSWHSYSGVADMLEQARYIRDALDAAGFADVPTCLDEWLPEPSHEKLGTAKQAAEIAAALIGFQNGPVDSAAIYDARCGLGDYSPLFNPLTYKPHKAYSAFLAFHELRRRGTAVEVRECGASRSPSRQDGGEVLSAVGNGGVFSAAARGADGSLAVMLANAGDVEAPFALELAGEVLRAGGNAGVRCRITDETRTWEEVPLPAALPPHSVMVAHYDGAAAFADSVLPQGRARSAARADPRRAHRAALAGTGAFCLLAATAAAAPLRVALTFDDSLKDHLLIAAPMLEERGWRGTFCIVTDWVGKDENHLAWDDIRELTRRGHEIATHTKSHPNLVSLLEKGREDEVRHELLASADKIAAETGIAPRFLFTPFVRQNETTARICRELGLRQAAGTRYNFGSNNCDRVAALVADLRARGVERADFLAHGVSAADHGGWCPFADRESFRKHLDALAELERRGEIVVTDYDGMLSSCALKAEAWPRHGVLSLSFDDANFDQWEAALPLFAKYDARATFFVVGTNHIDFMKKALAAGYEIGIHGLNHRDATPAVEEMGEDAFWNADIAPQLEALGAAGVPVRSYAYPNCRRTDRTDALFLSRGITRVRGLGAPFPPNPNPHDPKGEKLDQWRPVATADEFFLPAADFLSARLVPNVIMGENYHTDIDDILRAIARAGERGEALFLVSHGIAPDAKGISMKTEWLERMLSSADGLGVVVRGIR